MIELNTKIPHWKAAPTTSIKKKIAIMSGKGGVGKSTVTALLAAELQRQGLRVGVLDADITGPSIPRLFGIGKESYSLGGLFLPAQTKTGIKIMSVNLLLEEDSPVIWRSPLILGAIQQFYEEVAWEALDVLLIDLPPGTGDVPLTLMQNLNLDGVILVKTPQDLVDMIVKKSQAMVVKMGVSLLGTVENMAYFHCPDNGKKYEIFGPRKETPLKSLGEVPIDPVLRELSDSGNIEDYRGEIFDPSFIQSLL